MTHAAGIGSPAPSKRAAMKRAPLLVAASSSTAPTTTTRTPAARAPPPIRSARARGRERGERTLGIDAAAAEQAASPRRWVRCARECCRGRCRCDRAGRSCALRSGRPARRRRCRPRPRRRDRSRRARICSASHADAARFLTRQRRNRDQSADQFDGCAVHARCGRSRRWCSSLIALRDRLHADVDLLLGDDERRQQAQHRRSGRQRDHAVIRSSGSSAPARPWCAARPRSSGRGRGCRGPPATPSRAPRSWLRMSGAERGAALDQRLRPR